MRRHWRRALAISIAVLAVLAVVAVAAISWFFSSGLLKPDFTSGPFGVDVERVEIHDLPDEGKLVSFARDENSARHGVFSLEFPGGHGIVHDVVRETDDEVTRPVTELRGEIEKGDKVNFGENVWDGNPETARGIPFREVSFDSQLGRMPAWRIDGRGDTWAIFVHGHNVTREEGLRVLGPLHGAGVPTLITKYRNDPGAPPSEDGLFHLGATEWKDVDSAARYAIRNGARSLILLGDSMGGAIVTNFVHESPLAGRVRALILDAPVLNWKAVIDLQADERGLPRFLATTMEWAVTQRIDFDWDDFNQVARADEFKIPILLFHGTEDDSVPISSSEQFAAALPRLVTYFRVPGAGHVEAWNVGPSTYDRRVRAFLARNKLLSR